MLVTSFSIDFLITNVNTVGFTLYPDPEVPGAPRLLLPVNRLAKIKRIDISCMPFVPLSNSFSTRPFLRYWVQKIYPIGANGQLMSINQGIVLDADTSPYAVSAKSLMEIDISSHSGGTSSYNCLDLECIGFMQGELVGSFGATSSIDCDLRVNINIYYE